MHRAGWVCLLAAVLFGAVNCNSIEPGQEPARATEDQRTAVGELTAQNCSSCLDLHLGDFNLFLIEDFTEGHGSAPTVRGPVPKPGRWSTRRSASTLSESR